MDERITPEEYLEDMESLMNHLHGGATYENLTEQLEKYRGMANRAMRKVEIQSYFNEIEQLINAKY